MTPAGGALREYARATSLNYGAVYFHRLLRAGMDAERSGSDGAFSKARRTGEHDPMRLEPQQASPPLAQSTPSMAAQASSTANPPAEPTLRPLMQWGAIQALTDDRDGEILMASIEQAIATQAYTAYIDIVPVETTDVPPPDDRDTRRMVATFLDERLRTDTDVSVIAECLKYGAVRSVHLTGWPPSDRIYMCDFRLNVEQAVRSQFLGDLFRALGRADDRSPLEFQRRQDWLVITPATHARYRFAVMLMPASRSANLELTAFSADSPANVRDNICALLGVTDPGQRLIAVYSRATATGPLTAVTCWDPQLLSTIIRSIATLGTPRGMIQSEACYTFIRKLDIGNQSSAVLSTYQGPTPGASEDLNLPFNPGDLMGVSPRPILRPPRMAPGRVGPWYSLSFRYALGTTASVTTYVALLLANFFSSADAPQTAPEVKSTKYWTSRILARSRYGKPVRFCIATSWGAIFAGVYQALQGEVLTRIDSCTRIALSAGLCMCSRCIGGTLCNRCGKTGHVASDCPQSITTSWKDLTYRCPFCRALGGVAVGHEWDVCKDCRLIRMGSPTDNCCGICDHPEHLTPQCPSIQGPAGVILLQKMQNDLVHNGWAFEAITTPSAAAIDTAVQLATPSPSQTSRHLSRVPIPSSSASSTESTVSLATTTDQEGRMAVLNSQVYDMVSEAMRRELAPVQTQLNTISRAVEMQGGNIASLTEMLDDFGTRLAGVEAKEAATGQRLAKMRLRIQSRSRPAISVDQMSEHSQEDFQDANAYDPAFPSDDLNGAPLPPGLESPVLARLP